MHLQALREIQGDMREKVETYSTSFVFGMMGYLNASLGCAAITAGAVRRQSEDFRYTVQPKEFRKFQDRAKSGYLSIAPCTTWVSEYLAEHWPKASSSQPSVRKIRATLDDEFGVFSFDRKELTPWYKGQPKPMAPALQRFDIAKALLLFEVCEQVLKGRGLTLDDFPKHRGAVMVNLFNWIFRGIARFGRVDELLMGAWGLFEAAVEEFEELFFVASRLSGEVCDKIAQMMMEEERSYFEADIPY